MFRYLRRRSMLAGPLGGNRRWTLVWALLVGIRLFRRLTHPKPEIVYSEKLEPGESLLISGDGRAPRVIGGRAAAH